MKGRESKRKRPEAFRPQCRSASVKDRGREVYLDRRSLGLWADCPFEGDLCFPAGTAPPPPSLGRGLAGHILRAVAAKELKGAEAGFPWSRFS